MSLDAAFEETVELIQRAQAGEQVCLGRVLERYRGRLLVRIRWMMGQQARHVAESGDFLHGLFVKILERFDGFELRDERSFLLWATQIARNGLRKAIDKKREVALGLLTQASGAWSGGEVDEATPAAAAERAEQIARLVDVIAELDDDQQRIIELRHFEHLPFGEIGRRMGRSENAVQLLHTRVLLRLHQLLGGADGSR